MRFGLCLLLCALGANAQNAPRVGAPLPAWTPGTLDIHQISTGRGNSAWFVMPDGTTMLVDAGAAGDGVPETDPHPNASRSPAAWIERYVERHAPTMGRDIDYVVITHFHPDHYGAITAASPQSTHGPYRMAGITEIGDAMHIRMLLDRGWPDYDYPTPFTDSAMANYRRFVSTQRAAGMTIERFQPGRADQIRLKRDAAKFPSFVVQNIVANGVVWTGSGTSTRALFPALASIPKADWPNENMCSLGLRISYGPFRYFTGGDLPGTTDPGFPEWHAPEPLIASAIGPVDVHVVNQHGSMGEESDPFIQTLASTVIIFPSWQPSHPAPDVLKRVVNSRFAPTERFIFATDMREATKTVIGARAGSLAGPPGHIVVRVENGGIRYWVVVLSNADETDTVLAVKGPFVPHG